MIVISCLTRQQPSKTKSMPVLSVPAGRTLLLTGRPSVCGSWDQLPDDQCLHTSAPSAQSASLLRQVNGVSHSETARDWHGVHELKSDIQAEEPFISMSRRHEGTSGAAAQTSTPKHSRDRGSTLQWQSLLFNRIIRKTFTGPGQQQQCWQHKHVFCDECKEVHACFYLWNRPGG